MSRLDDEEEFVNQLLASQSPPPGYYSYLKRVNAAGAPVLDRWPYLRPLTADAFQQERDKAETLVVDTREIEAFGGAHIEGSVNIALRDLFPVWVGRMLEPETRLLLVLPDED